MISVIFRAEIPREPLTAEQSYERVDLLVKALHPLLLPDLRWWGGMTAPQDKLLPFDEREPFIERLKRGITHPGEGVSIIMTSGYNAKEHDEPGRFMIQFMPFVGTTTIEIDEPDKAFGIVTTELCKKVLTALARSEPTTFAYADVFARTPDRKFPKSYHANFATFPHRKCLGWMGFVPTEVTSEQLPLAARVEHIAGKGTLIVSVDEVFDLNNKDHIKRANQVEMDMVDAGLLPVTDPSLL